MKDYDLYDVIGEIAYGLSPKTMTERAEAFTYKNRKWLDDFPEPSSGVIRALASQFALGGTDSLENPRIFRTPEVTRAGGFSALRQVGDPNAALKMTKSRMFAA